MTDEYWMRRALELAARGRGAVEPNPMVGAVVVREGVCVGEGWHQRYGGPHAEVNALNEAGGRASAATLYVTLEPCCHHGKTPPCTDAVLAAGVSRVICAMSDPFSEVSGRGASLLRQNSIAVEMGVLEEEARRLNTPYLKLLAKRRPWVIAKWAMTLDGKIATRTGDSKWISNPESRRVVHELRGRVDGVLVGIGTALADNPSLTARPPGPRIATRIVLDSRLRLREDSQLARTARETPVLVATTTGGAENHQPLELLGCEVLVLTEEAGRPSLPALLDELGRRRFTNLLVEGGGEVLGAFLDAGEIDEVHVFVAPKLAGGVGARGPVLGYGIERIAEALTLREVAIETVAGDVYIRGRR